MTISELFGMGDDTMNGFQQAFLESRPYMCETCGGGCFIEDADLMSVLNVGMLRLMHLEK